MRKSKLFLTGLALVLCTLAAPTTFVVMSGLNTAYAQEKAPESAAAAPVVTVEQPAAAVAPAEQVKEPSVPEIFQALIKAFEDWKKIGWQAGLAALLMALVSTLKNTALRQFVWSKVPDWAKILVAPALSIAAFGLAMGKDFSFAAFLAAASTGVLAVYFHEFLDGLKAAPFIGDKWKWAVDLVGKVFKKKLSEAEEKLAAAKEAAGKVA